MLHVLIADDDPIFRQLLSSRLERLPAHVHAAADGREAWDLSNAQGYDLAILDLDMPGIDGITLIRCLRGHPASRHLSVIACSARDRSDEVQEALEAGANSYLLKPLKWTMFDAHVRNVLFTTAEKKKALEDVERLGRELKIRDAAFEALRAALDAVDPQITRHEAVARAIARYCPADHPQPDGELRSAAA